MSRRLVQSAFVLISFGLFGCATARPIIGPDGTTNQLISCMSVELCYEKAREVCGGPYKIVNTSTDTSGTDGRTDTSTKLLVKCLR